MVYATNRQSFASVRNLIERTDTSAYINPDNDPRGPWMPDNFTAQLNESQNPRASQRYTLTTPAGMSFDPPAGRCWLYTEPRYRELLADNRVWFGKNGAGRPSIKRFLSEVQQGLVPKTLLTAYDVGTNTIAKNEIQALFPGVNPFATPKPERLLERIIHIATNPGDIVLDCFAGSGTTAAVAHKMGRRWVTCELIEDTFRRYTVPRLTKVVRDEDPGGITTSKTDRTPAEAGTLPGGISPQEAFEMTRTLSKVIADTDLAKDPTITALKKSIRTRPGKPMINWRGGGGFTVAHMSDTAIDYDPEEDLVWFTDEFSGASEEDIATWARVNLNFDPYDSPPFCGRRGSSLLAVVCGYLDARMVDYLVSRLPDDHFLVIAATSVDISLSEHIATIKRKPRIIHIPTGVFPAVPKESK